MGGRRPREPISLNQDEGLYVNTFTLDIVPPQELNETITYRSAALPCPHYRPRRGQIPRYYIIYSKGARNDVVCVRHVLMPIHLHPEGHGPHCRNEILTFNELAAYRAAEHYPMVAVKASVVLARAAEQEVAGLVAYGDNAKNAAVDAQRKSNIPCPASARAKAVSLSASAAAVAAVVARSASLSLVKTTVCARYAMEQTDSPAAGRMAALNLKAKQLLDMVSAAERQAARLSAVTQMTPAAPAAAVAAAFFLVALAEEVANSFETLKGLLRNEAMQTAALPEAVSATEVIQLSASAAIFGSTICNLLVIAAKAASSAAGRLLASTERELP